LEGPIAPFFLLSSPSCNDWSTRADAPRTERVRGRHLETNEKPTHQTHRSDGVWVFSRFTPKKYAYAIFDFSGKGAAAVLLGSPGSCGLGGGGGGALAFFPSGAAVGLGNAGQGAGVDTSRVRDGEVNGETFASVWWTNRPRVFKAKRRPRG